jgi:hypothetical protein
MSITRYNPNTIFLGGGDDRPIIINDVACSIAITPGMLIERFNNGGITRWRPSTTNGLAGPATVALDQPEVNKGVDDVYAIGDLVKAVAMRKGEAAWMLIPSGQNVAYGDHLGDNGSVVAGTLKTSPTVPRFVALENKPTVSALTRLRVEAL